MNSYQRIKDYIFTNLQKQGSPLPDDQIRKDILACRSLMGKVGLDVFAQFLPNKEKLTELTDSDWSKMQKELETQFDVRMEFGILIQGENSIDRDPAWWSSKTKQIGENYYWDRYRNYLANSLNAEVIKTIDRDTDIVMDNIENPEISSFNRYGMVVGHVQSGKTGNYSALVCKAADSGYKFIVVIAGGMNNLRDQTQVRLNEYFVGQDLGQQVGVGIGTLDRKKLPISLTTKDKDFNKQDADQNSQGLNFDNISTPILLVIKKNTKTLANVIAWLEKQYKNQIKNHAMLLIDDESDYASINTKEEQDPTTINKRIRKLPSLFQKSVYVAYTATPYANIFIDHQVGHDELGQDLFPKDFIYALDAPIYSIGWGALFLDSDNKGREDLYVSGMEVGADINSSAFYYNMGDESFTALSAGFVGDTVQSFSNALGDFNKDGKIDLMVINSSPFQSQLWENQTISSHGYISIELEGVLSNRDAIGSRIDVYSAGQRQSRFTQCGTSFLGQNSERNIIGIGLAEMADSILIHWPTGHVDRLEEVMAGAEIKLLEGSTTGGEINISPDVQLISSTPSRQAISPLFSVYPNPTSDQLYFKHDQAELLKIHSIRLFNVWGQLEKGYGKTDRLVQSLDLSELQPGIYWLEVVTSEGQQWIEKLIKQ